MAEELIQERHDAVLLLRLNRPEALNALNIPLRRALAAAISAAADDPDVRAIVVSGGSKIFAAGGDIKEFADHDAPQIMALELQRIWAPIAACPRPIIAAVEGLALGGGAELAMHCDIILAAEDAQFAFPEVRLGILPGAGGTQRLPRAVGKFRAMRYLLTGDRIPASLAAEMGLVSELTPSGQAEAAALALAQKIARMPPLAVRQIKEVVLQGADCALPAALVLERNAHNILFSTEDRKEGVDAFIEKRKPLYRGL
ncbi:enoyl-CoA hydratase-related protein [Tropicimonas isoalkanivorans]|uniref:Enoyl-CoA hydratase/carnithine racemase n=1 Tax=Tropicimonas isoalkanivorans TaxID=441112 RepID=A0A1I1HYP7_9RHOB|nr:enoyl-CoA hydratase-related protein [Tropicimonas isoalkanivorans]SFC26573.1 Enoyl-CoA hydratase/carnithine racemase [Tropicimonas isoalkanivorans]